jgi:hypothetical protein
MVVIMLQPKPTIAPLWENKIAHDGLRCIKAGPLVQGGIINATTTMKAALIFVTFTSLAVAVQGAAYYPRQGRDLNPTTPFKVDPAPPNNTPGSSVPPGPTPSGSIPPGVAPSGFPPKAKSPDRHDNGQPSIWPNSNATKSLLPNSTPDDSTQPSSNPGNSSPKIGST